MLVVNKNNLLLENIIMISYRKDIDGLRSIAVVLVLFYHVNLPFLSGGFTGVDIFFAISGYLITSIIFRDILSGEFSYKAFYKRRISRLFPALFAVFIFTTFSSYLLFLPSDFYSFGKSLLAATFSMSNVFVWREYGGYFGGGAEFVPLLHTWSLSVEEQYYLIWPVIILAIIRFLPRKLLVPAVFLSFVVSLYLSEWVARITFGASYYLLPTRFFELAAGSILAIIWSQLPHFNRKINDILSFIGLSLILAPAFLLTPDHTFPGFNATYSVVGTLLIIISGKSNQGFGNKLLSCRPFVFIGLISYSLYLWHWPIIAYAKYIGINFSFWVSVSIVLISLLVSWSSWYFVEQKFRYQQSNSFLRVSIGMFVLPSTLIIVFFLIIFTTNGLPGRFPPDVLLMDLALSSRPEQEREGCHSPSRNYNRSPVTECIIGDMRLNDIDALLIGDSHANHFTGFLDEVAKHDHLKIQDYTLDSCLPVYDFSWGINQHYSDLCRERNDISYSYIKEKRFKYVILAGEWPDYSSLVKMGHHIVQNASQRDKEDFLYSRLERSVDIIVESGSIPVVVKDNPAGSLEGPRCPIVKKLYNNELVCETRVSSFENHSLLMDNVIDRLSESFPGLIIVDPSLAMCDGKLCYSSVDGIPLYRDRRHLNDLGSRALGRSFVDTFGGLESNIHD